MRELDLGLGKEDDEERRLHRRVLAFVLVEHPVPMTVAEIRTELGAGVPVEDAVAALVDDGLLARQEDEVVPTAAALRFHRLEPMEPPELG
jgi:hypothetical protein